MFRKLLFILLVLAAIFAAACDEVSYIPVEAAVPPESAPAPIATPAPQRFPDFGGTLYLTMRNPQTLNPLLNTDETVNRVLALIFERLFVLNYELRPVPNPVIVQSYTLSADARSLTIVMRDDIHWSDGTPMTAADVAFTINFLRNNAPENSIYRGNVVNITSTNITGNSIRINLAQPSAAMGYMLMIPIVPASHYSGISPGHARQMRPLGNGPFVFESYAPGRELVFAASPLTLRGPVYIQNVVARFTYSDDRDINAIANGVADALHVSEPGWSRIGNRGRVRVAESLSRNFDFVGFNFDNPFLARREARAAVAHAIPFNRILETVYLGEGRLAPTPVSPGSWLHDPTVHHPVFDLQRAAYYLAHALYGFGEHSIELSILANAESQERSRAAEMLSDNLRSLGLGINLYILPGHEYLDRLNRGDFDIFFGGVHLCENPDVRFLLHSSTGTANFMGYRSGTLDSFLTAAATARDGEAKILAYQNLQNYIAFEMPIIGLVFRTQALLVNSRVQGPIDGSGFFANVEQWYIETRH